MMNTKKIKQYLLKLKDSFLDETEENKKMLDTYISFIDGTAKDTEIEEVILEEGDAYEINRLVPHQVEALEEADIIESSTFHRDEDSYRVWRDTPTISSM